MDLEQKSILIYGPSGIGKSTLASQFNNFFFFNTAGELNELNVIQARIPDWQEFRRYSWAISESSDTYNGVVIDTGDKLTEYCSDAVRKRLGIMHEADAEWGKGWDAFKRELSTNLAKLASIPNLGLIIISHSKDQEVKTRGAVWNKTVPTLAGGAASVIVDMVDLVLFVDWAEDEEEGRVIKTKPARYHIAKERGLHPRLPAEIPWPIDQDGYDVLKEAWDKGGQ